MKIRTVFAVLLMVCLVLCAVGYGAQSGWSNERSAVENSLVSLDAMLHTRIETANNVLTVASRHLPEGDEMLVALRKDRAVLESKVQLSEKADANNALGTHARALLTALAALDSVKNDSRDLMYVTSLLPQMLEESEERTSQAAYNEVARDFNERLYQDHFSGFIARLLGVKPAEEFVPGN